MNLLIPGYHIIKRMWKKLYYRPIHLVFSFLQPLIWLTIFGFLFENKFNFAQGSYTSYLLPGVLAMTVLQTSAQSGILFIKDFNTGFFGRYHFTPVSKALFFFYKVFADYTRILFQLIIIILIGYLIGIKNISIGFSSIVMVVLSTFLFCYFYAAMSCFIALKTKTSELMATFIHLFNLPIIFTSTALIPNKDLPDWLDAISKFNPLSHLSELIRNSIINVEFSNSMLGNSILILFLLALFSFAGTTIYLKRMKYA